MNEKSKYDNLIGALLIMPIYMLVFVLAKNLNLNTGNTLILLPILMYLPIIIGMALSYKIYDNKTSKSMSTSILSFLLLAIYFYYNTYFVEHTGWDGLGPFFLWLINTGICKILACVYYSKIVGWQKGLIFLISYILIVVSSFALGFWA